LIIIIPLILVTFIVAWVLRPGRRPTNPRKVAILATAIPPLVVAIAAVVFQVLHNAAGKTWVSDISNTCFIIGIGLIVAAILVTIGFAIARKWEIARGIGFGICISVLIAIIELAMLEWLAGV
jgi:hypothetical protein